MKYENATLRQMRADATASGEIVAATADTITVEGQFGGGIAIDLRPGQRVFVITEDEAINLIDRPIRRCEGCEG